MIYSPDSARLLSMKILSIDPGLANLGWLILNRDQDGALCVVDGGVISTAKRTKAQARNLGAETVSASNMRRARELTQEIAPLFFDSEILIMEAQSSPRSSSSASKTAYCRGALIALATLAGLQVYEVQPKALKAALCGSSSAIKGEVEAVALKRLPELARLLDAQTKGRREHLADAAGVALAWLSFEELLHRSRGLQSHSFFSDARGGSSREFTFSTALS